MMLSKLAIKNLKTQFRYYLMYFVSMTFSVMVYYSFVSMSYDKSLLERASEDIRIDTGLRTGSVMIILFIIIFMFSANSFFVKRRKREIGLYSLLGMRRQQIGWLFFVENILLGLLALISGIFLGVIFSKLFAMILLKFMQVPVAGHFIVSIAAMKNTMLVFFIILIIVSIRTATIVYRFKLITLFKAQEQRDKPFIIKWYDWFLGILGIVLLVSGYYLAINFYQFGIWIDPFFSLNGLFILVGPFIILFLCVLGTYLLFSHFLIIALKLVTKNKHHYYRDIHMVTIGNLSFNLKKNGRTFATIAVLLGTALAAIGGAVCVQTYTLGLANSSHPTSYAVTDDYYPKLTQFLNQEQATISNEMVLNLKYVGGQFGYETSNGKETGEGLYNVISLSNYNQAKEMIKNTPAITLNNEKDVAILGGINQMYLDQMVNFNETGILGEVGEVNLVAAEVDTLGNQRDMRLSNSSLVVTDELYNKLPSKYTYSYHLIDVKGADRNESLSKESLKAFEAEINSSSGIISETTQKNGQMVDSIEQLKEPLTENFPTNYTTKNVFSIRYPYYSSLTKSTGLLIYVAIFLGMIFMIATGSIISLKQLSEAEDELLNYDLLKKLGTPKHLIKKNVYKQNRMIFFIPLVISLFHAYFAIQVLFALIGSQDMRLTYVSVGFLIIIYTILYFITSSTYYKIINR